MKRVRWVCELCGVGALGPRAPRRDNVVRYCLDCSKKSGRLVERSAPVVERERAAVKEKKRAAVARKTAAAAKRRATARQRAEDRYTYGRLDLRVELERIQKKIPELRRVTMRVVRNRRGGLLGSAYSSPPRVVIRPMAGTKPCEAAVLLVHELAHLMPGSHKDDRGRTSHGQGFRKAMQTIVREVYGLDPSVDMEARDAYALDGVIEAEFEASPWAARWKEQSDG